jgi:hypothetical protein
MQFEVERSSNNGVFNKIATVTAEDNSDNTYSYDDNKLVDGQLYYRLKMVDNVGRFSYSNIIVLSNDVDSRLGIYPNPATGNITVSVDKSLLNTEAVISDVRGAELKRIKITQLQNPISLQGLANGVYILKTASGATVRIVKQ